MVFGEGELLQLKKETTMARDEDIGRVPEDTFKVQRIEDVITATNEVKQELAVVTNELNQIKAGIGLVTGVNLDEEIE